MPFAPVNGIQLYYEVTGDGPAVVCAHGIGGNHASWYQQVDAFAEQHTVVTFDHRGFGRSLAETKDGRSHFVDDLEGLLDHLDIQQTALVAQSMGGTACVGFTARHPERVTALVLADTLAGIEEPPHLKPAMDESRSRTDNLGQLERVLGATFREREPVRSRLYSTIASFNTANRTNLGGSTSRITAEELRINGVPILFLVGEEDVLVPTEHAEAVHRMVPGSKFVTVPRAGHSVYFEAPEAFNQHVLGFLAEVGIAKAAV
ncbi:MAG: alpha/beta hydrolase [Dehalococcoidia bacterium]